MSYIYSIFVQSILYFNIFACCSFLAFFPPTYDGLKLENCKRLLNMSPYFNKVIVLCIVLYCNHRVCSRYILLFPFQTLQAAYAILDTVVKSTSYQKSYLRLHHYAQEDPENLPVQDHPVREFIFNFTNKFFWQDLQITSIVLLDASRLSLVG